MTNIASSAVQIFRQNNVTGGIFFNCTGTLINPRTVLTAAHCVNSSSSEAYGLPGEAPQTMLVATGIDTSARLFGYIGGAPSYAAGGIAQSTDVVIHPSANLDNGGLPFPWADVAFIALNEPITDTPYAPILLTPLDQLTHVIVNGYGTFGTGDTGSQGIGFLRLVGENMLGAVASPADLLDTVFPGFAPTAVNFGAETQAFYFIDFDNPNRTPAQQAACDFSAFGISCADIDAVKAIDWFDGDALPNEAGTAPGDSGSALIADQIADFPLVTAVLSGGFDFFGVGNLYGDISFYTPLYPFFEFITENTPYKYVSALPGDGNWSDPTHWTQDLDPGFYIGDGMGGVVNGVPTGSEPGVYEAGPKLGSILGNDISGNSGAISPYIPAPGSPNFGANTPNSSALLGPGSTGFVPNNTDGTPGVAFANPAQYFDVLLTAEGNTKVDMDVTIDRLTIDGPDTKFTLRNGYDFTSLIGVEQYRGRSTIDGTLNAGNVLLFGGTMEGSGTITTNAFFNVAGGLLPGGKNSAGSLLIDGDYIQTSAGLLVVDIRNAKKSVVSDVLEITGDASLAGGLFVFPTVRGGLTYGDQFTILTASNVIGSFDEVFTQSNSPVLYFDQVVGADNVKVEVKANSIESLVGKGSTLASLGATLDELRFGGRFAEFSHLFGIVDRVGYDQFGQTLAGLTPTSGFLQTATASNFAMRFTGQIAQRTLALRGAGNAAAGFSGYGSASFAQAGTAPVEAGKLGFFGSVSGSFLASANQDRNTGAKALEEVAFTQAGELTLGADYKLSDNVSFGMAVSNVRDGSSNLGSGGIGAQNNESVSGAAYAAMSFGRGFADVYVGFSEQTYGVARGSEGLLQARFGEAAGIADGRQTLAGARVGYAMEPAKGFTLGPVAAIDYVRSDLDGFREIGAGEFGLNVHDRTFTSIGAKVGAMTALDVELGKGKTLTAFGSVAYARELGSARDVVTANFVGAEDLPFSIARQLDPEWVSVNAGAQLSLSDRFSTELSLTSDMGRGTLSNHQANVRLNWAF